MSYIQGPSQIVVIDGVTFERTPDGREIAYRDAAIIGDIVPDGQGRGGWAYRLSGDLRGRSIPRYVRSRAEGRALLVGAA